jgi:hypothetical protein
MGLVQSRQPVATPAAQTLEAELDRIAALSLDEVRALWREMTQQNAPKALSRELLARMIAYRVQEQQLGASCSTGWPWAELGPCVISCAQDRWREPVL